MAQVKVLNNGSELDETNIAGLTWTLGESLYIGETTPTLDDAKLTNPLTPSVYAITVVIVDTVIYDGPVTIA